MCIIFRPFFQQRFSKNIIIKYFVERRLYFKKLSSYTILYISYVAFNIRTSRTARRVQQNIFINPSLVYSQKLNEVLP